MNTKSWLIAGSILIFAVAFVAGCDVESEPLVTESNPTQVPEVVTVVVTVLVEPEAEATAVPSEPETPAAAALPAQEAAEAPAARVDDAAVALEVPESQEQIMSMSLMAQKPKTEHSACAADGSFVEPATLEEIEPPSENSWRVLEPGDVTEFHTYDAIRVTEEGEALLDLGNLMRLVLKCDTVTQIVSESLAVEELARIQVDFEETPLLQRIVLAMHLSRGGFLGEKSVDSGPIALTTPNAVIIVSGTKFFLVYDPELETTWVGNFKGSVDVADIEQREGEMLPDQQLIAIPAVRNRKHWPIHEHMTSEEFSRLIDLHGSTSAAADLISGPYLVGKFDPELAVRNGPGTDYTMVGTLAKDEYVRVIGRGPGWWEIACPQNTNTQGTVCWVSGGSAYTDSYNVEDVEPGIIPSLPTSKTGSADSEEIPVEETTIGEDVSSGGGTEKPKATPTPAGPKEEPPEEPPSPVNTPAPANPYPE